MAVPICTALPAKALTAGVSSVLIAAALGGCAKTVSTEAFKGEQHAVAQAIANLQSDVTAGEQQRICDNDLAGAVVARLKAAHGGCKGVIKEQLAEIDSSDVTVNSVTLGAGSAPRTASAQVTSIYSGKHRRATVSLLKEGGKWKISAVS